MNTILFDIETTALVSRTWGIFDQNVIKVVEEWKILCFSYKRLGEKKVYVESLRNQDEKSLVKKLHEVLNSADIVIGHNQDRFDIRKSNAKFIEYGLPPTPDYHKIDTLKVARKYFAFTSNRLNDLGQFLGVGEKVKHPGFEMWEGCERGEKKWWDLMTKYNCLTPDHKVLNTNLKWVEIGSIKVGDEILAFDENTPGVQRPRRYKKAKVVAAARQIQDVYGVKLSNGDIIKCTPEHKWLTANIKKEKSGNMVARGYKWTKTEDLFFKGKTVHGRTMTGGGKQKSSFVIKPLDVVSEIQTKDAGWLSGMFDGEGSLSVRKQSSKYISVGGFQLNIAQKFGPELDRIVKLINQFNDGCAHESNYNSFKSKSPLTKLPIISVTVKGRFSKKIEFLQKIRPERLISKINFDILPQVESRGGFYEVVSIEYIGKREIVALETDTKTYIADGYLMHNCQDVKLLEKVYYKLYPWIRNHPNVNVLDNKEHSCPSCGSDKLQRRGYGFTRIGKYQRYQCKNCHAWSKGKTNSTDVTIR